MGGNEVNDEQEIKTIEHSRRARGATAVEYALILALIAGVVILAVTALGGSTQGMYQDVETELEDHGA